MPDFSGLDLDALIVGLMAATFVTFWLNTVDNPLKAASAIFFSGLLSGYGGPAATVYIVGKFSILAPAQTGLPALCGAIIGGTITWGLPILITYVQNRWGGKNA